MNLYSKVEYLPVRKHHHIKDTLLSFTPLQEEKNSLNKLNTNTTIEQNMKQRDLMRCLYKEYGDNSDIIFIEYSKAERRGLVLRNKNALDLTSEQYAKALYCDGKRKGWIKKDLRKII